MRERFTCLGCLYYRAHGLYIEVSWCEHQPELAGRPAPLVESHSRERERVEAGQGQIRSQRYGSLLHPLDLKETHVGVVPDRRIHVTAVRGEAVLNSPVHHSHCSEKTLNTRIPGFFLLRKSTERNAPSNNKKIIIIKKMFN